MIHVLNNLPKDYVVILDGLENHLMVIGDDVQKKLTTKKKKQLKTKKP